MSQLVQDVMTADPIVLAETATVEEAALAMREADVGDVLVIRGDEICSTDVTEVRPDDLVEHAIELMRFKAIRRLPVVEAGQVVGIVSLGDLACRRDPASALADISSAHANT